MPSQSPHWTLFDSDPLSSSDFHRFTQPFNSNKAQDFFVISAEHLPVGNENRLVASRSVRGAELAIEAARLAFSEIVENELDFSKVFLTLFSKQWKAATLLDAVKYIDTKSSLFAIDQLSDTAKITDEQQEILALYDPSIALFYQSEKQFIFLSLSDTEIALVNRRYHCEIKEATQVSLSKLLVDFENAAEPPFQLIDIEEYQLEMVALLSHRYTASKTMARLHSTIIKCYRQLESKNSCAESTDNSYLLLFKKEQANPTNTEPQIVPSAQLKIERDTPRNSMVTLILSLFALITATASSYFFWQAQATETGLSTLVESKPQESPKAQLNTQIILNNHQKDTLKSAKETLHSEEKAWQEGIKKQQAQQIKTLQQQQQQEQEVVALKQQNDLRLKIKQIEFEALKKQEEQIRRKAEATKAEKLRLIEEKAQAKQKELLKQQQALELAKAKKELKEKRLKAEKLAREEQEKVQLLLLEQDIERMNREEEEIRAQKEAEQKKRKEEQLRVRRIELEQERKKYEQLAKIEAEKRAEDKRLEALVRQRRLEFEANKAKQRLEFENNKIRQQREKEQAMNPLVAVAPIKLEESSKPQDITKSNAAEKKRNMLAELKRQKQSQAKAKTEKLRLKQKTAIHQLVNYSKTFNQHTTQLKQKLDRLAAIDQRSDAFSNKVLIHKRKLLKGKEAVIRARLVSIAGMYLAKLKLVCAKEKLFPVSTVSSNKTERIARRVISQHVSNCSQVQSLSASRISTTLLGKYLR